jgi:hypothetical protein
MARQRQREEIRKGGKIGGCWNEGGVIEEGFS